MKKYAVGAGWCGVPEVFVSFVITNDFSFDCSSIVRTATRWCSATDVICACIKPVMGS